MILLGGCAGDAEPDAGRAGSEATTTTPATPTSTAPTSAAGAPSGDAPPGEDARAARPAEVTVAYRVERRTGDPATESFAEVVHATLADPRGWVRAGFRLVPDPSAPYLVVLAEPAEVDQLCLPYRTGGRYSCQNGPVVAINADRWRSASPQWTGDLPTYRQMLVNHEVGHLLGQRHPEVQCPEPGTPAPVMAQQTTELRGCLPNPWPLEWEIVRAARHDLPLAPGYGE